MHSRATLASREGCWPARIRSASRLVGRSTHPEPDSTRALHEQLSGISAKPPAHKDHVDRRPRPLFWATGERLNTRPRNPGTGSALETGLLQSASTASTGNRAESKCAFKIVRAPTLPPRAQTANIATIARAGQRCPRNSLCSSAARVKQRTSSSAFTPQISDDRRKFGSDDQDQQDRCHGQVAGGIQACIHGEDQNTEVTHPRLLWITGKRDHCQRHDRKKTFLRCKVKIWRLELIDVVHQKTIAEISKDVFVQPESVRIHQSLQPVSELQPQPELSPAAARRSWRGHPATGSTPARAPAQKHASKTIPSRKPPCRFTQRTIKTGSQYRARAPLRTGFTSVKNYKPQPYKQPTSDMRPGEQMDGRSRHDEKNEQQVRDQVRSSGHHRTKHAANVIAIINAQNHTTPFSPNFTCNPPTSTSNSHSHANHGLPGHR